MKIPRSILFAITLIFLGTFLSACAGGAGAATSWPGLTVDGDTGYLAINTHVYAINLVNGIEEWRFPAEADGKITFFAPPALTEDGQLIAGGYNHVLYSLNPDTGQENQNGWPFLGAENHYVGGPLATDQGIYAPAADGSLYALGLDGSLRWSFTSEHALWATPASNGEHIYQAAMDHHLYAFDPETGNLAWESEDLGGAMVGTPTVGPDGTLYVGTLADKLLAIDPQSGRILNEFATNGWVWAGPALAGDRLYFGDLDGYLYAINAADFSEVWKIEPDTQPKRAISDTPLVLEDSIYFSTESGNVYAVNIENGNTRWNKTIDGSKLYSSPKVSGDTLLVTPLGIDAVMVAFDFDGNQKWQFTPAK